MEALPRGAMLAGHLPILEAVEAALGAETTLEGRVAIGARLVARALVAAGQADNIASWIASGTPVWRTLDLRSWERWLAEAAYAPTVSSDFPRCRDEDAAATATARDIQPGDVAAVYPECRPS